jgi:outer membrane protein assembly factor BamB
LNRDEHYVRLVAGQDGRVYFTWRRGLAVLDPQHYPSPGVLRSTPIEPAALILSRALVGGPGMRVEGLACGQNGRVYGVMASAASWTHEQGEPGWLFWYDAQRPKDGIQHAVLSPDHLSQSLPMAATILELAPGRLLGGTGNGDLFSYDVATGQLRDFGPPISGTWRITGLALGHDGRVYGTIASQRGPVATLFAFDPRSETVVDTGLGQFSEFYSLDALTVAPDGRVFASASNRLLAYDPASGQSQLAATITVRRPGSTRRCYSISALATGLDGRIYGACDAALFTYDPGSGAVTELELPPPQRPGVLDDIVSLAFAPDGRACTAATTASTWTASCSHSTRLRNASNHSHSG